MRVFLLVKGNFLETQKAVVTNVNDQRPVCLGETRHGGEYMWEVNVKDHTTLGHWFKDGATLDKSEQYKPGTLLWFRFLETWP